MTEQHPIPPAGPDTRGTETMSASHPSTSDPTSAAGAILDTVQDQTWSSKPAGAAYKHGRMHNDALCQCGAEMVYTNGAKVGAPIGTLAPPMNANGSGRNRTLICDSVRRTGSHTPNLAVQTRIADTYGNTSHAITFALCESTSFTIEDESTDPDTRMGARTYVFLVNQDQRCWHGYVTPETLAVLRHLASSVVLP